MITAHNKQAPMEPASIAGPTTASGGFGKVLNSIQGLQQRLGDFSVEDITSAEADAHTLMRQLARVQDKLVRLADLKRSLAEAEAMITVIPKLDYDLVGPASLEKHPQLHAIVKASKVIRLHRLLKIAKASEESVSFDAEAGRLEFTSLPALVVTSPKAHKYPLAPDKSHPEAKVEKQATVMSSGKHSSAEVIELPSLPPDAIPIENFHELVGQEPVLPTAQGNVPALSNVEPEPLQSAYSTSSTPVVSTQVSKETTATLASAEAVPTDGTAAIATKRKIHATEAIIEQATTADDWKQDLQTPTARKSDLTPNSVAASKTAPEFDDERTSKSVDSAFDQRLLDDLIQTYGELVPLAQASKTRVETSATRIEPSLRQLEISLSPEPKFVAADPVTAVDAAAVESAGASVPVRQHGDLDHQLKKIIKDYGEYDLYSHASHSSATLKRGGIAAFVVLGLVLSGFYFFRSPAKTNPPRANSVLPASEEPSPAVPQSAKENIGRFTSDGGAPIDLDKKPNDAKKSLSADKTKTK